MRRRRLSYSRAQNNVDLLMYDEPLQVDNKSILADEAYPESWGWCVAGDDVTRTSSFCFRSSHSRRRGSGGAAAITGSLREPVHRRRPPLPQPLRITSSSEDVVVAQQRAWRPPKLTPLPRHQQRRRQAERQGVLLRTATETDLSSSRDGRQWRVAAPADGAGDQPRPAVSPSADLEVERLLQKSPLASSQPTPPREALAPSFCSASDLDQPLLATDDRDQDQGNLRAQPEEDHPSGKVRLHQVIGYTVE